jgi:hypothetical protein
VGGAETAYMDTMSQPNENKQLSLAFIRVVAVAAVFVGLLLVVVIALESLYKLGRDPS